MTSTNSLKINQRDYKHLLSKVLKHDCYVNSFNSTRKQEQNFLEQAPTINDFTSNVETLNISLPFPITKPCLTENNIDYCTTLLLEKQLFNEKLDSFMHRYKKDKKWLTKKYVKKTKYGELPKYVFDLSAKNIRDPDMHFSGNYNWYYTGGVLSTCAIFNEKYLIYPNDKNLLSIGNDIKESHIIKIDTLDETPIFSVQRSRDEDMIVSLRQKHKVHILKLRPTNDKLSFNILTSDTSNKVPYIDVKYFNNEISVLKLGHELNIRDLDRKDGDAYTFESANTSPSNSFGQFEYIDKNTIIFLDRNSIRLFDRRSKQEKKYTTENNDFKCDELCTFSLSNHTDYVFLSSVHNIYKFDLRDMNIVKKWSHMLSSPPLMMKMEKYFGDELLFVSSQNYDERVILLSNIDETNLVQMVPNNIDTWKECNRIHNFHLFNKNEKKLKYSTVGISVMESNKGIALYTANCLGDIFRNDITREIDSSVEPLEHIDRWMNSIPTDPEPLVISHVRELSHIRDALNEPIKMKKLERYTKDNRKRLDLLSDMTLEDIDMAAIWLTEEKPMTRDLVPSTSVKIKVSEWLRKREEDVSDNEDINASFL